MIREKLIVDTNLLVKNGVDKIICGQINLYYQNHIESSLEYISLISIHHHMLNLMMD